MHSLAVVAAIDISVLRVFWKARIGGLVRTGGTPKGARYVTSEED